MADLTPVIEILETRWMRAWVGQDPKALKSLTARTFILMVGSRPGVILDYASWLDAADSRWRCTGFRFGDVHVRSVGSIALFASQLELKSRIDGEDRSGTFFVTDLWRKRRIGGWRMVERVMSRADDDPKLSAAIKSMQLWR
jgi:ketosteroid isomerase-like protein